MNLFGLLLLVGVSSSGCESRKTQSKSSPASREPRASVVSRKTTSPAIALSNLDGAIEQAERRYQTLGRFDAGEQLIEGRLLRFRVFGRLEDLDRLWDVAKALVEKERSPRSERLFGRVLAFRHRFEAADRAYDRALRLGAEASELRPLRALNAIAVGRLEDAEEALSGLPSLPRIAFLRAALEAERGNFAAADGIYRDLLATEADVSPFPVAEIYFRRGVLYAERLDRPQDGLRMYEEGLKALPEHVTMAIHRAELLKGNRELERAIGALEALRPRTDDPGLYALLGALYLERANPEDEQRAEALIEEAQRGYEARLERHREAFLDHASEFFRGPGKDPERALSLALQNREARKTDRAALLVIEAAEEAGDRKAACSVLEDLRSRPVFTSALRKARDRLRPDC